jgi:hypothetical protein
MTCCEQNYPEELEKGWYNSKSIYSFQGISIKTKLDTVYFNPTKTIKNATIIK